MRTKFKFKKNIFSSNFKIYDANREIGFIKKKYFSQQTIAELNGEKITFNDKGIFDKVTEIIDSQNKIIGKIKYNIWRKQAFLRLLENKVFWQYENMWNTKWKIKILEGKAIEFDRNGSIMIDKISDNELEVLSALYIYNHYQKANISALFLLFTPLFVSNTLRMIH